jgi:flagellar hook-associated protein 1 FlgK
MSGLFSTLRTSNKGLQVNQTALQTVSHNVSNSGTEGYSLQRVHIETSLPLSNGSGVGQIGTGAEVASITRVRDSFLDYQIRKEKSISSQYAAREEFLSQVDSIFNEPSSTGLSNDLSSFWDAWSQLASSSESTTARTLVVSDGKALASSINQAYEQLSELQDNAGTIIKQDVFTISGMLDQIKNLNTQIKSVYVSGQTPNDLLDRRDLLLDQLSEKIEISTESGEFGGISVSAKVDGGKITLIDCDNARNDNGLAYISSMEYYIENSSLSDRINVLGLNSSSSPESIKYNNTVMGLLRDNLGAITGISINGTTLAGDGNTVTFSDGKQIQILSDSQLMVDGQTVQVDTATGKITVDGNDIPLNSSGQLLDTSSNKILFDGLSFKLTSGNTFSSFEYGMQNAALNNGSLFLTSNGNNICFNKTDGTISIGQSFTSMEDINLSYLDSSSVKAAATLYMNGNINKTLRLEDIAKNDWADFKSGATISFNYDEYEELTKGTSGFNVTMGYSDSSSFSFQSTDFTSGSIIGYNSTQDEIQEYKNQLNNLARVLAISVNQIHSGSGEGISFFTKDAETSGEPAKVIAINPVIDSDSTKVNAGKSIGTVSGDGTRAGLISKLQTTKFDILAIDSAESFVNNTGLDLDTLTIQGSSSGTTMNDYFNSLISELRVSSQEASKVVDNQDSLLSQLETRKESISGISLDEEMINMVQFQKAYVANAKMISTVQQMLDAIINLI